MGSKKRSSDNVQLDNTSSDEKVSSKKIKKLKKNDANTSNNDNGVKPMERKKKRKALDKEKHKRDDDNGEVKQQKVVVSLEEEVVDRSSCSLPEFHIEVFKDLSPVNVLVREAAAERLAMELKEVQKAYDMLEKKEDVDGEGLKLEAEKDDGLNNCAPSVRYAVRRLIRGVSSSREV